jgi:hypothetical protein
MTLQVYLRAPSTSILNFPEYCRLRISCRFYKRRSLLPTFCAFRVVTCFEFCLSHKAAVTGFSVRFAAALVFLLAFDVPFVPAA